MRMKIGARESRLSLIQVREIIDYLKNLDPTIEIEVVKIKTRGDVDKNTPLYIVKEKGIFEREVNKMLLDGLIDVAVHNAKDIPFEIIEDKIVIASIPPRRSRYDVLFSEKGYRLWTIPTRSIIGTSSLRRMIFVNFYRDDLIIKNIRGNVDTRIDKLKKGLYDAIILAEAGLERLNIKSDYHRIPIDKFIPAAGQGGLIVMAREDDRRILKLLNRITDFKAYIEIMTEKLFIKSIGAGCKTPIGVTSLYNRLRNSLEIYIGTIDPGSRDMLMLKQEKE